MPREPLIAPALVRQAVRSIKQIGAGAAALIKCEFALDVAVYTISTQTGLSRANVNKVLKELTRLPEHCVVENDEDDEDVEDELDEIGEAVPRRQPARHKQRCTTKRGKTKGHGKKTGRGK